MSSCHLVYAADVGTFLMVVGAIIMLICVFIRDNV